MLFNILITLAQATEPACKPKKLACDEMIKICQLSGFAPNMDKGFDLWADCINPMMQNKPTPAFSLYQLPAYPSDLPEMCKKVRPNFGNGTVGSKGGYCSIIKKSCESQGFVPHSVLGNDLLLNCINPIMQHKEGEAESVFDLPQVTQSQVNKCKDENPFFGSGPCGNPIQTYCYKIKKACIHSGFENGKSHCGYAIMENCVNPIMQNKRDHADNILPLPAIDSEWIVKCKQDVPKFGLGTVGGPISPTCSSCQRIKHECIEEGFVEGKSHDGFDLLEHCIKPNMQQTNPNHSPSKDIPCIRKELIEQCKHENPKFGL